MEASAAELRILEAVSEVSGPTWDALFAHEPLRATPFVRHAWLDALEQSGSTARAGWKARHLTLWQGGRLVAAAPAYVTRSSEGDFSRDWQWAAAAEEGGIRYYPKLVMGVPFTPATGRRVLAASGQDRRDCVRRLVDAALALARSEDLGCVQVLFPDEEETAELSRAGLATRLDFQYHWRNAGYRDTEEFLARFPSRRRNVIRRERAAPARQGIAIRTLRGEELAQDPRGWARRIADLHRATVDQLPWGQRWVGADFFERVLAAMPESVELVEARRQGALVAMALNVASPARLYGRYWGAREAHPFLHFNVCLYHSIDECIRRGIEVFEGGAGGEHKLARGFEPAETYSAHAFLDPRLDRSLRRYLRSEERERREAVAAWRERSPLFKKAGDPGGLSADPR